MAAHLADYGTTRPHSIDNLPDCRPGHPLLRHAIVRSLVNGADQQRKGFIRLPCSPLDKEF